MEPFISIPTFNTNTLVWGTKEFTTREEFVTFLWSLFKQPGEYEFDEASLYFNFQARKFNADKWYCAAPFRTKDYINFWDFEAQKCRRGVIYTNKDKTWYITRDYYMWLNFLPIYNKEISRFAFADVRDAQYHMALYEDIARYSYKHAAIFKKRQIASSYFHAAKLINNFWFEEGSINKMAGSLKDYIAEKGTWRFFEEYRNFLNEHTAWYRPCNPDKVLNWEQKIEETVAGRKKDVGLKSVIIGLVLEKDPTNGVGGPCSLFFHEEAGIASKMNETIEYLLPSLKSGMIYTGFYVVAGSVGDLEQCEPLKELIYFPNSKDVLGVETNLLNASGEIATCGLFIPEQWSMLPCIDEYGNSLVEKALEMILAERVVWKKQMSAQDYQLRISQKPINIEEGFANRKVSAFPQHLLNAQKHRIESREYFQEHVDLSRDDIGKVIFKESHRLPITEFPISARTENKEGVVVMFERPADDLPFGSCYASIDPVAEGKTTTSNSLCSIIIYKADTEVITKKSDGTTESMIQRGKVVATWCGRFDDLNKTHELLEMLLELYKAYAVVENNVALFIQYMILKKKQRYLVPKNQMVFLKDIGANTNVFQEYGWRNVGTIFKGNLLSYAIQFVSEEIDHQTKTDGEIVHTTYGVERIPDIMIIKEMMAYKDGLNVDRLIAFAALVAFINIRQANIGYVKKIVYEKPNLEKPVKSSNLQVSPFRHLGKSSSENSLRVVHQPFKNLR